MMRALFKYPGSKWSVADWIVDHFPNGYERKIYVEPFLGSGGVFFKKTPSTYEIINDIDGDVVNLFRVLRERPDELAHALKLTPYSRKEYDLSFEPAEEPVERARRFMVRSTQGVGAKQRGRGTWQCSIKGNAGGNICKWNGAPYIVEEAARRFRGTTKNLVHIENRDAVEVIRRYNMPNALIYLDPPYVRRSRKGGALYRYEMDDEQHVRLLEIINKSRAKIIISGYQNALYDQYLKGWKTDSTASRTTSGEKAIEMIWMNYNPPYEQIHI